MVLSIIPESDRDDASSVVSTTVCPTGVSTPDSTEATECSNESNDIILLRDAAPWAGDKYMIIDEDSGRALTVVDGALRLENIANREGGRYWYCVEKDGWLRFRNTTTGTYLGNDLSWKMHARAPNQKGAALLHARRHPDGGYVLLAQNWFTLFKISIGVDGNTIFGGSDGGTRWEFVKVQ